MAKNKINNNTEIDLSFIIISIILWGVALFHNTFKAPFYWDDYFTIVKNPVIRNIANLKWLWAFDPSRFLTYLSFAFNYHFSRLFVPSYHAVNLSLHFLNSFLVYLFCYLLHRQLITKNKERLNDFVGQVLAFFSALIFLSHPIQTQAVNYISQRSTLLATAFYLATLILYLFYRKQNKKYFYFSALACAFLGLFTKPIIITLPFAVLMVEGFFFSDDSSSGIKRFTKCLPFLLMVIIVPMLLVFLRYKSFDFSRMLDVTKETTVITRGHYLMTQINVVALYFRLMFVPVFQNIDYDYPLTKNLLFDFTWFFLIVLASLGGFAVKVYKKQRLLSFCIFWIFLTLALESSFFPISDVIFEHRLYLPMVGFAIGIVLFIRGLAIEKRFFFPLMVAIVLVLSVLTYQRNILWSNKIALLKDTVLKSPNKARVHNNLGLAFLEEGLLKEAEAKLLQARDLDPNNIFTYINLSELYRKSDRLDKAFIQVESGLKVNPDYFEIHNARGFVNYDSGHYEKAIKDFNSSLNLNSMFYGTYYQRGLVYYKIKKYSSALDDFNKALAIHPTFVQAFNGRGLVYRDLMRFNLSLRDFSKAIFINPRYSEALYNRAMLYKSMKEYDQAIRDLGEVISINSKDFEAYSHRAALYAVKKKYQHAIEDYDAMIFLKPENEESYSNRGMILQMSGKVEKAIEDYTLAIKINPRFAVAYYNRSAAYMAIEKYELAIEDALRSGMRGHRVDDRYLKKLKALSAQKNALQAK